MTDQLNGGGRKAGQSALHRDEPGGGGENARIFLARQSALNRDKPGGGGENDSTFLLLN
jgi:hypothetical protein